MTFKIMLYGAPILSAVFILLVALKLFNIIDPSWWLVASPLIVSMIMAGFIYFILSSLHF